MHEQAGFMPQTITLPARQLVQAADLFQIDERLEQKAGDEQHAIIEWLHHG